MIDQSSPRIVSSINEGRDGDVDRYHDVVVSSLLLHLLLLHFIVLLFCYCWCVHQCFSLYVCCDNDSGYY